MMWHGSFRDGDGSYTASCRSWTTNSPNVTGLAADFAFKHLLDQGKEPCNSSLVVLCIEIPQYLVRKYIEQVLSLPVNTTKLVELSSSDHRSVLEKYDEEWKYFESIQ